MVPLRLLDVEVAERELRLRMPFRFGVLTLTSCPQLHVKARVAVDGRGDVAGHAAELALPKWFDKDPALSEADNVRQLRRSLEIAVDLHRSAGRGPSAFALHRACAPEAEARGAREGLNPLVAGFGVALVDRALLDALCRATGTSFFDAVRRNLPGLDASLTPELRGFDLDAFLRGLRPAPEIAARHTVGLLDPLTAADAAGRARPDDPLPFTLEECIARSGLTHFKLKISGKQETDLDRLARIAAVLDRLPDYRATLDGNEQYRDEAGVLEFWRAVEADRRLDRLRSAILFIEQPIARGRALEAPIPALARLRPVEIDESDGTLDAFVRAKDLGYTGVSSKSCKGVYKSILNRARCEVWNAAGGGGPYFMSAEDLVVQAGVSLQQDLSLASLIGCAHGERNGHHYVNGMAHRPTAEQARHLEAYPRLYERGADGVVRLAVRRGRIDLSDLGSPGFGSRSEPEPAFAP